MSSVGLKFSNGLVSGGDIRLEMDGSRVMVVMKSVEDDGDGVDVDGGWMVDGWKKKMSRVEDELRGRNGWIDVIRSQWKDTGITIGFVSCRMAAEVANRL